MVIKHSRTRDADLHSTDWYTTFNQTGRLQVEDDDVALLHCRLSWSGTAWEIKAANLDGVEVNGKLVREANLTADDTVRVGAIDIRLMDDAPTASDAADESEGFIPLASSDDDISLKPLDKGEKPAGAFGVADAKEEEGDDIQLPKDVQQERWPTSTPAASRLGLDRAG